MTTTYRLLWEIEELRKEDQRGSKISLGRSNIDVLISLLRQY